MYNWDVAPSLNYGETLPRLDNVPMKRISPLNSRSPSVHRYLLMLALFAFALVSGVGLAACDDGTTGKSLPAGTAVPLRGDAIFARYCNTCHPGGGRGVGPSLTTRDYSVDELKAMVRHGKAQMPGFGASTISDADLDALVAYVQGMRH